MCVCRMSPFVKYIVKPLHMQLMVQDLDWNADEPTATATRRSSTHARARLKCYLCTMERNESKLLSIDRQGCTERKRETESSEEMKEVHFTKISSTCRYFSSH